MTITTTTLDAADRNFVLGETLRPLLTHAMGSGVEVFDTSGPAEAGPPPHRHPWEEVYVVLSGQLEVTVEVASEVEMNPPDIAGVVRVAAGHDIEFVM